MNKYDASLNLDERNNLSVLIKMIRPNSKILEVGPATGRLTKYLKEFMSCDVTIVEIDEEAYKIASQYSSLSILGDIESFEWTKELSGQKFDYIIFSDVLEHLKYPDRTLVKVKDFLKEEGRLLISIPNVSHNSVIADLLFDRFDYQNIGILDNTHLKYFTYGSAKDMLTQCGYSIEKDDCIRVARPIEFQNSIDKLPDEIIRYLYARPTGNVYQIILCCTKTTYFEEHFQELDIVKNFNNTYSAFSKSNLYIDCGYGYSETTRITAENEGLDQHCSFTFDLIKFRNIQKIRWDPTEGLCCKCKINTISSDGIVTSIMPKNIHIHNDEFDEFLTTDPYFEILGDFTDATFLKLDVTLEILGVEDAVNKLNFILYSKDNEIINLHNRLNEVNSNEAEKLKEVLVKRDEDISKLNEYINKKEVAINNYIDTKEREINNQNKYLDEMKIEIDKLNKYIDEVTRYARQKDNIIDEMVVTTNELEKCFAENTITINVMKINVENLNKELKSVTEYARQKEKELESVTEYAGQKDKELKEKNSDLALLAKVIEEKETIIEQFSKNEFDLKNNLLLLKLELDKIKSTKWWKFINSIKRRMKR